MITMDTANKAIGGNYEALKEIEDTLVDIVRKSGREHAEIEALRIAIYTIAGNTDCQVKAFRAQLMKIIERASR
jgi:hypothetical protein